MRVAGVLALVLILIGIALLIIGWNGSHHDVVRVLSAPPAPRQGATA